MDHLPGEITTDILSRLPPRYVLRCRSVCKTWRRIIDDHRFARSHYTRSLETDDKSTFIFLPNDSHAVYLVEQVEKSHLFEATKMEFSCPENCSIYASYPCNGFLCLGGRNGYNTYIYNPVTQECVELPNFVSSKRILSVSVASLGLGFDRSSNIFKVLQMLFYHNGLRHIIPQALVATVGSNSWRKLENFPCFICSRSSPALVNGFLHWISTNKGILSFDLGTENFGFLEVPQFSLLADPQSKPRSGNFALVALGGCLSVVDSSYKDHIELWIMKDYNVKESWVKLVIMRRFAEDGVLFKTVLPISLWRSGEILLLYDSRILVSYEIESGRYTPLQIDGLPEYKLEHGKRFSSYKVYPYVGNLMPLETICKIDDQQ